MLCMAFWVGLMVLACSNRGTYFSWSLICHLILNNSMLKEMIRGKHKIWDFKGCVRGHQIQLSIIIINRIQESSVTHGNCPFLIFKRGFVHLRQESLRQYVYKSDRISLHLHWIFLRQNASDIQAPPKCDEDKYLQTRLQCILSFCGSEGQKDNVSSSHNFLS